jgi:hypothetical protein
MVQSLANVFDCLSDEQSVMLFTTIALKSIDSIELRSKISLTSKQYYSRLSRMMRVGLIKRRNRKLVVTTFGKIMYELQKVARDACNSQWRLKVLDSVEASGELPKEERLKLLDNLIESAQLKEILLQGNYYKQFPNLNNKQETHSTTKPQE